MKTVKDWCHTIDLSLHDGMSLADEEREVVKIIKQIQIDVIEHCAEIAKAHRGAAAKKRPPLRSFDPETADAIRDEERGEDIASEEIYRKIKQTTLSI